MLTPLLIRVHQLNREEGNTQIPDPVQQAMQRSLIGNHTAEDGDGRAACLALDRNIHVVKPTRPAFLDSLPTFRACFNFLTIRQYGGFPFFTGQFFFCFLLFRR